MTFSPYTKEYQGPATAQCDICDGHGYITPDTGIDACPACAARARFLWAKQQRAGPRGRVGADDAPAAHKGALEGVLA